MKAVFFECDRDDRNYYRRLNGLVDLTFYRGTVQEVVGAGFGAWDECGIVSTFVHSVLRQPDLERFPALRLICTRSTGFDHIDLGETAHRGITVSNVPSYGENTVAEHTFALILALSRNLRKAYLQSRTGKLDPEALQGFDLEGKVLGVVGAGRIGLHAIKIGKGFGMRVLAYDVRQDGFLAELMGFSYVPLDQLLRQADVITLHAPYTESTLHLINRETLREAKRGALLINTARGELVDTEALVWALDEGILGGAGLDVLEGEGLMGEEDLELLRQETGRQKLLTLITNNILMNRENVIITPHIAFNSAEAVDRIRVETAGNIQAYLGGHPRHVVNPPVLQTSRAAVPARDDHHPGPIEKPRTTLRRTKGGPA